MIRAFFIFIPIFFLVMFFNQVSYGGCFEGYCLKAALPKVTIISVIISIFISSLSGGGSKTTKPTTQPGKPKTREQFKNSYKPVTKAEIATENPAFSPQQNDMRVRSFNSFQDASKIAKELSIKHDRTIRIWRKNDLFIVEYPFSALVSPTISQEDAIPCDTDTETPGFTDDNYDEIDNRAEIHYEISDFVESLARSEEDGWFYGDSDDGWENNIIDRNS